MPHKKQKFVPISEKNKEMVLPGRRKCDCAATKHDLINNCLNCGRIICIQEGAGPCWFCGEIVADANDLEKIKSQSNHGLDLLRTLERKKWPHQNDVKLESLFADENQAGYLKAIESKQKLLEFDKNSSRRTKVIDDQKDYFNTNANSWLTKEEKAARREREAKLREQRFIPEWKKSKAYAIDLKTGNLIEQKQENTAAKDLFEDQDWDINSHELQESVLPESNIETDFLEFLPQSPCVVQPAVSKIDKTLKLRRIQDQELHKVRDEGLCLSMHQPWASLLVKGIKMHEGRTWYSNHRGRLWIAATAKEASKVDIEELKQFYKSRGASIADFPESYPTGCILGCVNVVDCLSHEDYREQYPDGESESIYVFICDKPQELSIKFPIKGKHKIYKLESHVHQAAKLGLR